MSDTVMAARTRLGTGFARLWGANAVANLGDGIGQIALPLLAASVTRDPLAVASVATAGQMPWLLLSAFSGVLLDRVDRRRVLILANLARVFVLLILVAALATGIISIPLLWAAAFALATAEVVIDNGVLALVPRLVAKERLTTANGRLDAAQQTAQRFAGPPAGSVLFAWAAAAPFVACAATFSLVSLLLARIQGDFRMAAQSPASVRTVLSDLGAGFRWLFSHPRLRNLALLSAVFNIVANGGWATMVLFAQDRLGLSEQQYGLLLTASGLGGIMSALLSGRLIGWLGAGRSIFLANLMVGASFVAIGMSSSWPTVAVAFVAFSFFIMVTNILVVTYRQTAIPDGLLGRVNGIYRTIGMGAMSVGTLTGGIVAKTYGLHMPLILAGGAILVLATIWPLLLNERSLAEARA